MATLTCESVRCLLCGNNVPGDFNGADNLECLLEHIRNEVNYAPLHCGHKFCMVSWPSKRLFDLHHRSSHPNEKMMLIDHSDQFLSLQCERLTRLAFPGVLEAENPDETLSQYLHGQDSSVFFQRLNTWWKDVHYQALLGKPTCKAVPKGETSDKAPSSEEPTKKQDTEEPKADTESGSTIEKNAKVKKHVRADYSRWRVAEYRPYRRRVSTVTRGCGRGTHAASKILTSVRRGLGRLRLGGAARGGLGRGVAVGTSRISVATPRRGRGATRLNRRRAGVRGSNLARCSRGVSYRGGWSQYTGLWPEINAQEEDGDQLATAGQVGGTIGQSGGAFQSSQSAGAFQSSQSTGAFYPSNQSGGTVPKSQSNIGVYANQFGGVPIHQPGATRKNGLYQQCALCQKRLKKNCQRKHAESHLRKVGEFRYECLLCPGDNPMRTMFDDSMKTRHIPHCHKVPKPQQGVHFNDYLNEFDLLEKIRRMIDQCFPPI